VNTAAEIKLYLLPAVSFHHSPCTHTHTLISDILDFIL